MAPGTVITELKGSMANLTTEEDMELKRTDLRHSDIRRDFSVIHSKQMKKNHLFLGPARFVNVCTFTLPVVIVYPAHVKLMAYLG
jgi:[histone H4]-N-methyl-L-lysine20 N-methyltransferase